MSSFGASHQVGSTYRSNYTPTLRMPGHQTKAGGKKGKPASQAGADSSSPYASASPAKKKLQQARSPHKGGGSKGAGSVGPPPSPKPIVHMDADEMSDWLVQAGDLSPEAGAGEGSLSLSSLSTASQTKSLIQE